jgi:hypothetical protein
MTILHQAIRMEFMNKYENQRTTWTQEISMNCVAF